MFFKAIIYFFLAIFGNILTKRGNILISRNNIIFYFIIIVLGVEGYMDLGTKFKNIRYNNNITQEEMAKILKINRNNLSRIETNKSLPTSEVLMRLAESFNISIEYAF